MTRYQKELLDFIVGTVSMSTKSSETMEKVKFAADACATETVSDALDEIDAGIEWIVNQKKDKVDIEELMIGSVILAMSVLRKFYEEAGIVAKK